VTPTREGVSVRRVCELVDVAISWPGITCDEASEELQIKITSVRSYAAAGRRWGWIWGGYAPRLVDTPEGLAPARARVRMSADLRRVYDRICDSWRLEMPIKLADLTREGMLRSAANEHTTRLRRLNLVAPTGALFATRDGYALRC